MDKGLVLHDVFVKTNGKMVEVSCACWLPNVIHVRHSAPGISGIVCPFAHDDIRLITYQDT